jgi:hypothetical protein
LCLNIIYNKQFHQKLLTNASTYSYRSVDILNLTNASTYSYRSVDILNLTSTEAVISVNLTTPDGLAVDWIADNIYWTDAGRQVLEVAHLDGSSRKIIIWDGLVEPRAVALFPRKG